jgi:hypothetical protein
MIVMNPQINICRFASLPLLTRATSLQIPDLLCRSLDTSLPIREDRNEVNAVALLGEEVLGWVRFFPRRLLLYRDSQAGLERLRPAALIEFPVTERFTPDIWEALLEYAFAELFELGVGSAGIYLPPECSRHAAFLQKMGFYRFAECDSLPYIRAQGYSQTCSVWLRPCSAARGYLRPDMYGYLAKAGVLYTANVNTAPDPSAEFWSQSLVYSGYSGYPVLSDFLDTLVEDDVRSILSVPCATADLFRLLPTEKLKKLDYGTGLDITDRNLSFGKARLLQPHLDIISMLMCHAFFAYEKGGLSIDITELLAQLCAAAGRRLTVPEATEYYQQLQAAFAEVVLGGAITDWFALMKGFGRFLALSVEPNIFIAPKPNEDGFQYCVELAEKKIGPTSVLDIVNKLGLDALFEEEWENGREAKSAFESGRIELKNDDMFTMDLGKQYDLIFVWEAALMVVGANKEEAFLDRLRAHLKPKGRIVLTGIRAAEGQWPRDLTIMMHMFSKSNFKTSLIGIKPRPARWAFGYIMDSWFPVLIAQSP